MSAGAALTGLAIGLAAYAAAVLALVVAALRAIRRSEGGAELVREHWRRSRPAAGYAA